jgi:hypothetical protein
MRAFKTLVLPTVFLLIAPAPAQAWWAWLDDLSGPGKFRGPQFEFRLVCFGEESEAKRLVELYTAAYSMTSKVASNPGERIAPLREAEEAWDKFIGELNASQITFPILDPSKVAEASGTIRREFTTFRAAMSAPPPAGTASPIDEFFRVVNPQVQPLIAREVRGISSISSTGIFLSACSTDKKRRSSIELGASFLYADGNSSFANGQQIRLTTLMPEFSLRVFTDPRFDFLDAGLGAGIYWFTSKGFNSFSGVVLQPGRLDFHAPTLWSTYPLDGGSHILRRIAAAPTFRFGLTMFPAGFSADAFAGVRDKRVRIPGELIPSWSLFINLEPFVRKAPFVKTAKGAGVAK